jgi:hypothetical protein
MMAGSSSINRTFKPLLVSMCLLAAPGIETVLYAAGFDEFVE